MKTSNTSERLQEYMRTHSMKQVDLLKAAQPLCEQYNVKMNKSDISQYVSGKVEPGQDKLFVLARALRVTEAWLMGYDTEENTSVQNFLPSNVIPLKQVTYIPLIGLIACGTPVFAEQNIEQKILLPDMVKADFALRCKGDSMIGAGIDDGDIVFIRQQPQVENGEIAAVQITGIETEATLKKVYLGNDSMTLVPQNPGYAPLTLTGERLNKIEIIGKCVAVLKNLE